MAAFSCQEMVELVTDYLEGSLGWRARRRFERHLAGCDGCDRYLAQMRETLDLLGTVPVETLSNQAQSRLMNAFGESRR